MDFIYEIRNGVGVLKDPNIVDLSIVKKLQFGFDFDRGTLKIGNNSFEIKEFVAVVPSSKLGLGSVPVAIYKDNKYIPCQPIKVFNTNNRLDVMVALDIDLRETVQALIRQSEDFVKRIKTIETANLDGIRNKLNELVVSFNDIADRVELLEKNYDPTEIKN